LIFYPQLIQVMNKTRDTYCSALRTKGCYRFG